MRSDEAIQNQREHWEARHERLIDELVELQTLADQYRSRVEAEFNKTYSLFYFPR